MRKLRIISNGKPGGTKICDADTGEAILHAKSITFKHDAMKIPSITVELLCLDGAEIELHGEAEIREIEIPCEGSATTSSVYKNHRPPALT